MDARPTCQNQPQKLQRQERRSKQQQPGQYCAGTAAAQLGPKLPRVVYQLTRSAGLSFRRLHGRRLKAAFASQQLTYGYIQHISQRQKQRNIRQPLTCLPTADGLVGQLEFICQLALRPALSAALRSNESTDFCGIHV